MAKDKGKCECCGEVITKEGNSCEGYCWSCEVRGCYMGDKLPCNYMVTYDWDTEDKESEVN